VFHEPGQNPQRNAWKKISEDVCASLLFVGLIVLVGLSLLEAQTTRNARHVVPTGKGWGMEVPHDIAPPIVITGNGINYHGGPVIKGTMNAYFIWYGNWTNGPHASDSQTT